MRAGGVGGAGGGDAGEAGIGVALLWWALVSLATHSPNSDECIFLAVVVVMVV